MKKLLIEMVGIETLVSAYQNREKNVGVININDYLIEVTAIHTKTNDGYGYDTFTDEWYVFGNITQNNFMHSFKITLTHSEPFYKQHKVIDIENYNFDFTDVVVVDVDIKLLSETLETKIINNKKYERISISGLV